MQILLLYIINVQFCQYINNVYKFMTGNNYYLSLRKFRLANTGNLSDQLKPWRQPGIPVAQRNTSSHL